MLKSNFWFLGLLREESTVVGIGLKQMGTLSEEATMSVMCLPSFSIWINSFYMPV